MLTVNELCRKAQEKDRLIDRMRYDRDQATDKARRATATLRSALAVIHWVKKEHTGFTPRTSKEMERVYKEAHAVLETGYTP